MDAGRRTLSAGTPDTAGAGAPPLVLVVMGVSGSGKSTIAGDLRARLGWPMCEGDDLHPPANVAKMAAGIPLTDADRSPWLDAVRAWIQEREDARSPALVTCSALRRTYRDRLRDEHVVFVYLQVEHAELSTRMTARHGHFMPASLLASQLATLEPPGADEQAITVAADASIGAAQVTDEIVAALRL